MLPDPKKGQLPDIENTQRVNLFLDPAIVKKAKLYSIAKRISLSKLVDEALADYLLEKDLKKILKDSVNE